MNHCNLNMSSLDVQQRGLVKLKLEDHMEDQPKICHNLGKPGGEPFPCSAHIPRHKN